MSLQESYPEKFAKAEQECLVICLPDTRSLKKDVLLDDFFFDHHILKLHDEGWYRGTNPNSPLIVERQGDILKLVSGPDYQPSFQRGLYKVKINQVVHTINKKFCQYKMFTLDRPLLPKYSKASLNSLSSATSGISSISSNSISSQNTVTTVISVPPKPNGKTSSRASSAASLGRPYQTKVDEPTNQRKARSAPEKPPKKSKKKSKNGRQWSADSGVETGYVSMEKIDGDVDTPFILPPRITTYAESECYLMNLPRCDQFASHLARNLKPLISELKFSSERQAKELIKHFANKLHRLAQESVIAFPRSASTANNSPRFQEFLRIAVENVVVGSVHALVFPPICHLSRAEDRELLQCIEYLHQKTDFSADQLGLPEDFCIPLPAAVVELSALDHHTTPLDRMTCIYDTVQQIGAHIRQAVLDTHADSDDIRSKYLHLTSFGMLKLTFCLVPDDLAYPNDREMVLLLATVIVQSRPKHLLSTLNYADIFAWAVPSDMM